MNCKACLAVGAQGLPGAVCAQIGGCVAAAIDKGQRLVACGDVRFDEVQHFRRNAFNEFHASDVQDAHARQFGATGAGQQLALGIATGVCVVQGFKRRGCAAE